MFEYSTEQSTLRIRNVRIGGIPGKIPTVLIPSLFYTSDKHVRDPKMGNLDVTQTEATLAMLTDLTERTGLSTMLDIIGTTPEAMDRYLRYLADATEFPLLIDGSDSTEVNVAGIETAKDAGILDRVIINSLTPSTEQILYDSIHDTGLRNALLLTFDTSALVSSNKRVELADQLINKSRSVGVKNILIDAGVLDIPTLGIACKTQHLLKTKYGYPVGSGAHNAVSTWKGLIPKFGQRAKEPALVGANLMPVVLGADFVLMGPAKHAPIVYPIVAMADAALSGIHMETRERPEKPHPRYMIS